MMQQTFDLRLATLASVIAPAKPPRAALLAESARRRRR
jgi:hypothetical protein